jgi:hypothetical protein
MDEESQLEHDWQRRIYELERVRKDAREKRKTILIWSAVLLAIVVYVAMGRPFSSDEPHCTGAHLTKHSQSTDYGEAVAACEAQHEAEARGMWEDW